MVLYAVGCNQNIFHCVHCLCFQQECKFHENRSLVAGGAGAHFVLCCTPGTSNCAEHLINNLYAGKHKLMNLN